MVEFVSIHGPFMTQYLEFKRNLGYAYRNMEYQFGAFDRLLDEKGFIQIGLSRWICDAWGEQRPNETETNRYSRINIIYNYSRFLNGIGHPSYLPRLPRNSKQIFSPHIFPSSELSAFFTVCDELPITSYSITAGIYPALFRLLYGCGLRINEALSLNVDDVDFVHRTVTVRRPKNGEDRIVPFSVRVGDALAAYSCQKTPLGLKSSLFFSDKFGRHCSSDAAYEWFRRILFRAGIPHGGRRLGPRVHDFRHTFAVHSLASMAASGLDLYYCLPILSKYLGHKSVEATETYVRLTEEMFPGIMSEMNKICAYVFPEVGRL